MQYQNNGKPGWVKNFTAKYTQGISHAFLLHFNVTDYIAPGVSLRDYLSKMMATRQVVVIYNRAEGLIFPLPSHREKFVELLGLNTPQGISMGVLAGLRDGNGPNKNDPKEALLLLTKLLRMSNEDHKLACVIIEYAEAIFGEGLHGADDMTNLVLAQSWGRDPQIMASGNVVFLVTDELEAIAAPIRKASSRWEAIPLPLPDRDARLEYIRWYFDNQPNFETELTQTQIASATAFLQLVHIEDIFLRAEEEGRLTLGMIKERKQEIIATEFADVLEIWEPEHGFEMIGGLQTVKDFFTKNVIAPLRAGNTQRAPKGVLMMGPAGTGKSVMAEAVARECGVNACQLNLSKIFDKYVGSTERNMEKVINAIKSLAPVIVFIDEIDQSVDRGGGGDNGITGRVFKRLLEVMADESLRGKVLFLAATNRPDLMDAALKRPGRLDRKIAFFVPDEDERAAIIQTMIAKYLGQKTSVTPGGAWEYPIAQTDGWTGAELVELVRKAGEIMEDEKQNIHTAFTHAVDRLCPTTQDIAKMTAMAMAEINDFDLIPPKYQEQWKAVRKSQPRPVTPVSMETATNPRQAREL